MSDHEFESQVMVYGQESVKTTRSSTVVHYQSAEDCKVSEDCFAICNPEDLIRRMGSTTAGAICKSPSEYNAMGAETMVTIRAFCKGPKQRLGREPGCNIRYETAIAPMPDNTEHENG